MNHQTLRALYDERIGSQSKGFGPNISGLTLQQVLETRPRLGAGDDFVFPLLTLKQDALSHNVGILSDFCREHGVELAPHGKAAMAPQLFAKQSTAGAWGVTVATCQQARVFRHFGATRVLIANELLDETELSWILASQTSDPRFECYFYLDSLAGVALAEQALSHRPDGTLTALIEIGYPGGRSGCRTLAEALAIAHAAAAIGGLNVVGVAGYEGLLGHDRSDDTVTRVREYLQTLTAAAEVLGRTPLRSPRSHGFILSAGGSAYPDLVVETLTLWARRNPLPVTIVLRSGSYLTHDDGLYEQVSPFGSSAGDGPRLRPALELWARVLSVPERGLAIVGAGRRDVSSDSGLPFPHGVWRADEASPRPLTDTSAIDINDQHLYLDCGRETLKPGDLVAMGISHPCTTLDKWSRIPVLDDGYRMTDCVKTFF